MSGTASAWSAISKYRRDSRVRSGTALHRRSDGCSLLTPAGAAGGFTKIWLEPGQTGTAVFELGSRAFAHWCADAHDWKIEAGHRIEAGASSSDIRLDVQFWAIADQVSSPDPAPIFSPVPPAMRADWDGLSGPLIAAPITRITIDDVERWAKLLTGHSPFHEKNGARPG